MDSLLSKRANGEGSIVKHGSRWKAVIVIGYKDDDPSKPIRRTKTCKSKAEAREAKKKLEAKYFGPLGGVTIAEYYERWKEANVNSIEDMATLERIMNRYVLPSHGERLELLQKDVVQLFVSLSDANAFLKVDESETIAGFFKYWMAENKTRLRNNSIVSYRRLMENHILPRIGSKQMATIKPIEAAEVVTNLIADGVGSATIRSALNAVRAMYRRAVQLEICETNPFATVRLPKHRKKSIEPFTEEEVQQIIEAAPDTRLPGFWRLAFQTGMRYGEISALHWSDVDFGEATIHVHRMQSLQEDKTYAVEEVMKTDSARRTISVSAEVLSDLNGQRKLNMVTGRSSSPLVFPSATLKAISPQSHHRYDWQPLLKRLGIKHRNFHQVRHTFATMALAAGIEITTVSKMLGHANSRVTLGTYAHAIPQRQQEAVAKIERMYG